VYRHTQTGYLLLGALGAALLVFLLLLLNTFTWVGVAVVAVLAASLVAFGTLTVQVDAERLTLRFGPGFLRKSFLLREIESARPVTNPFWYGWGIHLTPSGWLYNVSGLGAVEIALRGGGRARIGTDEPQALALALEAAIRAV
jgi:hypothetical protein